MTISIDEHSGFCFGVTSAIRRAEQELQQDKLFCLGDIVHNSEEVQRLAQMGLETIDYDDLRSMHGVRVLFRAHGEPPSTYRIAEQNQIRVFDATCPVVLALQKRIRQQYNEIREASADTQLHRAQIVIYGQPGHAEVIGLQGQTNNTAIVVESEADLNKIDYTRPIYIFSQTTKSVEGFRHLVDEIQQRATQDVHFADTICRNVANRVANIRQFAASNDIVFFVGGRKSSNAKVLYNHCLDANPKTIFISSAEEIEEEMLPVERENLRVGICGATSTPLWLMEQCCDCLTKMNKKS